MDKSLADLVKSWFKKAEHDLEAAEIIMAHATPLTDVICFHCQQCAEKYLKGFLTFYGIEFTKTHNLRLLVELAKEKDRSFDQLKNEAILLKNYAVEFRYPGEWYEIELDEAAEAIRLTRKVKRFVLEIIEPEIEG